MVIVDRSVALHLYSLSYPVMELDNFFDTTLDAAHLVREIGKIDC